MRLCRRLCLLLLAGAGLFSSAHAWGPEGHEIVALIAQDHLTSGAREAVTHLLSADTDTLTAHDIASEATWADAYRDSGRDVEASGYHRTALWHYINLELRRPDFNWACWKHPGLPHGVPASQGPGRDCIVDKIDQFEAELAAPQTSPKERLLALKFLLHLVGDLHQPLHAADNHDHGGNDVRVSGLSRRVERLHHAWDSDFVRDLGHDPRTVAARLNRRIDAAQIARWQQGSPESWARESWDIAQSDVYGPLPEGRRGATLRLDSAYVRQADHVVADQLSKAGVRLAWLLNRALGH